jgi:hypothetical protein
MHVRHLTCVLLQNKIQLLVWLILLHFHVAHTKHSTNCRLCFTPASFILIVDQSLSWHCPFTV